MVLLLCDQEACRDDACFRPPSHVFVFACLSRKAGQEREYIMSISPFQGIYIDFFSKHW